MKLKGLVHVCFTKVEICRSEYEENLEKNNLNILFNRVHF